MDLLVVVGYPIVTYSLTLLVVDLSNSLSQKKASLIADKNHSYLWIYR